MKQQSRLLFIFLTVAAGLIVSTAVTYVMGHRVLVLMATAQRLHRAVDELDDVLSTFRNAETGQRGFILTGDARYLQPYNSAIGHVKDQFGVLRNFANQGDLSPDDLSALQSLSGKKFTELATTIDLERKGNHTGALELVETDLGISLMDQIRDQIAKMTRDVNGQIARAQEAVQQATSERTAVFVLAAAANLAFLAWAYGRIKIETDERNAASLEAHRQRDLLAVTLASIGDAVIVTDATSRITFMNQIAEELTGWSSSEAIGQICQTVFNIINEDSRATVESPVDKVLREGLIVGLANHTLLIRRDKNEVPIDDSGAPIRDSDGTVRGVVLVFRDFSEHKASERELRTAKTELEAASRAKDQFLAALSHELRTPLTPVLATLTSWEADGELPVAIRDDMQMLRRNLELEARLIDDLLDLTRIAKGKLRLNLEITDVQDLLRSVTEIYKTEIDGKNLVLSFDMKAGQHHVNADPARLQQVFWNILRNATKFSSDGGKITIATVNHDDAISISISDTGIGMTAETMNRLFLPFEQGSENTARQYGGLGLGMAISKALMDAQGGLISANSHGLGLGSTFSVEMPVTASPEKSITSKPVDGKAGEQSKLSILLVEDHGDTARVMARILQGLGHQVQIGDSKARALTILADGTFDLLLSDIGLPDGTGIELIRDIRASGNGKLRAIALTGYGMEEDIAKCREAGFEDHLTKPVSFQRLETLVQRVASEARNIGEIG